MSTSSPTPVHPPLSSPLSSPLSCVAVFPSCLNPSGALVVSTEMNSSIHNINNGQWTMHNAQCLDLDLDLDLWMWMWMVEVFMIAVSGVYCNGLLGCGSNSNTFHGHHHHHHHHHHVASATPTHSLTHSLLSLTLLSSFGRRGAKWTTLSLSQLDNWTPHSDFLTLTLTLTLTRPLSLTLCVTV